MLESYHRELINPVETEHAFYEVVFGIHSEPNFADLSGIDALVVETGRIPHAEDWPVLLTLHPETEPIVTSLHSEGVPLYTVDVASPDDWLIPRSRDIHRLEQAIVKANEELEETKGERGRWEGLRMRVRRRSLQNRLLETRESERYLIDSYWDWMATSVDEHRSLLESGEIIPYDPVVSLRMYALNFPKVVWRDAITAEKCEEHLAPKLAAELGRKPHIALFYGSGHQGIVDCLVDERRRSEHLYDMYQDGVDVLDERELYGISRAVPLPRMPADLDVGWEISMEQIARPLGPREKEE